MQTNAYQLLSPCYKCTITDDDHDNNDNDDDHDNDEMMMHDHDSEDDHHHVVSLLPMFLNAVQRFTNYVQFI